MLKGDISNEVAARFLVVFEGLVADLPDKKARARFDRARKFRHWDKAINQFVLNEQMAKVIWDTVWRRNCSVDVVTFLGDDLLPFVREWIEDRHNLPVGRVTATDKYMLARELNYRPDVISVYHSNPSDIFVYGSKGVLVDPRYPTLIGGY